MKHKPLRLETKIIILVWSMVALALLSASYLITKNLATTIQNNISENTTQISHLTAMSPLVINALTNPSPDGELREYCFQVAQTTKSQFVVVFNMNSVRISHPDAEKIGQRIVGGDEQAVLTGIEYVSISKGTLGDSLRAFSPVYDQGGTQIGAVVVGVSLNDVQHAVEKSQKIIYLATALGLLIGAIGAIATFRDMTEVRSLAEELTGVSSYVEALRAQAHEFMNKMQVVLGMIHMECYDQLADYVKRIASEHKVEINFVGKRIRDAVIAGFILSKISQGRELNIEFTLQEESYLPESTDPNVTHSLVTILGNLLSNAFDAMNNSPQKKVTLLLHYENDRLNIQVTDTGVGMDDMTARQIFQKGFSTKDKNRGLGMSLVKTNIEGLQGTIEFFSTPGNGTIFYITIPYKNKGEKHV